MRLKGKHTNAKSHASHTGEPIALPRGELKLAKAQIDAACRRICGPSVGQWKKTHKKNWFRGIVKDETL